MDRWWLDNNMLARNVVLRNLWWESNISWAYSCADPERGQGLQTPSPWKIIRIIGFLSNTDHDHLKIKKLLSQQCWAIISTPVKRHLCSARLFQSSLCSKQFGSGLNCSHKSSLIQVHNSCLYGEISHWRKHKLHFPYITTHMSSTCSLLKDVFEAIYIDPDLIGAVWSWSQMFVRGYWPLT